MLGEAEVRELLERHGCSLSNLSWQVVDDGRWFEYRMTIRTGDERNFSALARSLGALAPVREFRISPAGD